MKIKDKIVPFIIAFGVLTSSQAFPLETVSYYHNDALGSAVAMTDDKGNIIWTKDYLPFGEDRPQDANGGSHQYTGQEQDGETGLYYYGARFYDPNAGRFLGIDPVGGEEATSQSWNRYIYTLNNPYKYVDPDGRRVKYPNAVPNLSIEEYIKQVERYIKRYKDRWDPRKQMEEYREKEFEKERDKLFKKGSSEIWTEPFGTTLLGIVPIRSFQTGSLEPERFEIKPLGIGSFETGLPETKTPETGLPDIYHPEDSIEDITDDMKKYIEDLKKQPPLTTPFDDYNFDLP